MLQNAKKDKEDKDQLMVELRSHIQQVSDETDDILQKCAMDRDIFARMIKVRAIDIPSLFLLCGTLCFPFPPWVSPAWILVFSYTGGSWYLRTKTARRWRRAGQAEEGAKWDPTMGKEEAGRVSPGDWGATFTAVEGEAGRSRAGD